MKKISIIVMVSLALMVFAVALAAESIKYDFDEVEVKYAAEFTAKPVSVDADNWIVQIAGGADNSITVLYGVIDLKNGGETKISEEFIKVSGEGGSERFLLNSATYDYYQGTSNYSEVKSFFWSAKKLVDTTVVKDFTPPIQSISLHRKFNEDQKITSITLSFSNDGETASQEFWSSNPENNLYQADVDTLNQSGDPTATTK